MKIKNTWFLNDNKVEVFQIGNGWSLYINGEKHTDLKPPSYFREASPEKDYHITIDEMCFIITLRGTKLSLVYKEIDVDTGQAWAPARPIPGYMLALGMSVYFIVYLFFLFMALVKFVYIPSSFGGAFGGVLIGALGGGVTLILSSPIRKFMEKIGRRDTSEPKKFLLCLLAAITGILSVAIILTLSTALYIRLSAG